MEVRFSYFGHSGLRELAGGSALSFVPNLSRDPVSFDAPLLQPLRFREAISALHDVVINDLRFKPRDKTAYEEWKKNEALRVAAQRREAYKHAKAAVLEQRAQPISPDLEKNYRNAVKRYWEVRLQYSNYLVKHDLELWRLLTPCDPIVTVADDVVFFECFSADESSYGCLTVRRDGGFGPADGIQFGTTNVDYSWNLYNEFQQLRTYRQTRFKIDPQGFEVATTGSADYREEKIDLPSGWLRGLMQVQTAMGMPMRRVTLSRECVYSLLAWLKRHKARKSPRALRFELLPGESPRLVLEPWEQPFQSLATRYDGPGGPPIRVWGTRRLLSLARVLPLAEKFHVYLLGTGLPSFWVADMGDMQLTLGLSGWTTNDWTHGSALDALRPPVTPALGLIQNVVEFIRSRRSVTFSEVSAPGLVDAPTAAAVLGHLAHTGQIIYDLTAARFRWRQIMPQALGEAEMGPENPELVASRDMLRAHRGRVENRQEGPNGSLLVTGNVAGKPVELLLDADGTIRRGKCLCGHHQKAGLRMGPCRHLLTLRQLASGDISADASLTDWYHRLRRWTGN